LSPSSIRLHQRCPRAFHNKYVLGIEGRQEPDDKLKFGTAFAKIIEHSSGVGENLSVDGVVSDAVRGLSADLAALVAGTAAAYRAYWAGSLKYRATELKLVTPLRNPRLTLTTILDGLAETEAGDLVVIDEKTTSSDIRPGSWFWEKLVLDLQVSTYTWAARANGHPVAHAIWDAVRRPNLKRREVAIEPEYYTRAGKWGAVGDLKPGTGIPAETPAEFAIRVRDTILEKPTEYFQRERVVRLTDELEAAMEDVEHEGQRILDSWDRGHWPRNSGACFDFGQQRRCEYFEICAGSASASDDQLYQLRKSR
jgi:hypothetical protein